MATYNKARVTFQSPQKKVLRSTWAFESVTLSLDTLWVDSWQKNAAHLQHFLSFIGKDTKLKELEHKDCENYFYHRHKATNGNVKQVTMQKEQSTINALIKWLHKNGETHIDGFDFKKLPRLDKGNEAIRRLAIHSNRS